MSATAHDVSPVLTPAMVAAVQALIPRYPNKRAVVLPALHIVNDALRYVPLPAVVEIARLLDLAPSEVQDTLSFYGLFPQQAPHGQTRAWVCRSISCALRGGDELLAKLCQAFHLAPGETTPDGRLTLEYGECLGACEFAPCILAGKTLLKNQTPESAEKELRRM